MTIAVVGVGRLRERFYRDAADEYLKRLKRFGPVEEIELPDGVEVISGYAFRDCKSLKSVKIPDTVRELGYISDVSYGAFAGCSSLTYVDFPGFSKYTFNFSMTPYYQDWKQQN